MSDYTFEEDKDGAYMSWQSRLGIQTRAYCDFNEEVKITQGEGANSRGVHFEAKELFAILWNHYTRFAVNPEFSNITDFFDDNEEPSTKLDGTYFEAMKELLPFAAGKIPTAADNKVIIKSTKNFFNSYPLNDDKKYFTFLEGRKLTVVRSQSNESQIEILVDACGVQSDIFQTNWEKVISLDWVDSKNVMALIYKKSQNKGLLRMIEYEVTDARNPNLETSP